MDRVATEVRNLLDSLNEENYDSVVRDLSKYFDNGPEESLLVVATCLDYFDVYEQNLRSTNLEPAIASLFRNLMQKPHFSKTFTGLMQNRLIHEDFLDNLSTALKLSVFEKVGFGLTLLDSANSEVKSAGRMFCLSQCEALCDVNDTLDTVAADVLDVLRFLEQSEALSKHSDSFKMMVLQVWLNANSHFILAEQAHDTKLLSQLDFPMVDHTDTPTETSASLFAKMLGSWNQLSYRCGQLRVGGFQLCASAAFSLLMYFYRTTCQAPFPLAVVCGDVWENTESQLLFLKCALSSPPEVFTFAHCKRQLEYIDHMFQADYAYQPWLCVDLLEVLCQIAEKGHANSVWSLLDFPLMNCPEVLILGMAHVITPYNLLQHEVCKSVIPMLLKDSSKSGIILHLWCVNPLLLSRTLNDYLSLDPEYINRFVDLFHELEILTSVLDVVPMSLGIKLAAIASRKEYIDLIEWLTTNLSTSEDVFFEECIRFLNEVEMNFSQNSNIYKETLPTFSKVLQLHAELLASTKLTEQMESLYLTCMQDSPEMENIDDPEPSTSASYADHSNTNMHTSSSPVAASTPAQLAVTSPMFGSPISINTLLAAYANRETPIEPPTSEIQDGITFMINNLSAVNIEAQAKEFTAILAERYYPWFAQYLVVKRASIEPNFHNLYINFLGQTRSRQLNKEIVQASYETCKVVLRSELIRSSVEERKLLKNLGSWLGKLTIGRNQPLLAKHIDPKSLITEAYEKGLMIGVIPFVAKIMELCQSSVAYQVPNPWTMAVLELLVEIYAMPNLKANLTFEIEVLFKNLEVDMKSVKPTSLLKDKVRITEGNPDFSQRKIVEEVKSTVAVNQVALPAEAAGPSHQGGIPQTVYQPSVPASNIQELQSSFLDDHFFRILPMAMNKAVEELVSTFVERSVSIASQTAIELALKDYTDEADEDSIHSASNIMVVFLAGNLSTVICKEPLRHLTLTHLRKSAMNLVDISNEYIEDSIDRVINANLHLGCLRIEKSAQQKALVVVKKELTERLANRKKQKEASKAFISKAIEPSYTTDTALNKFHVLLVKLEALIANDATEAQIQSVTAEVQAIIRKCIRKDEAALDAAKMVFEGLYENASNTANINSRLTILAAINDVNKLVLKELTGWVLNSDDMKFNKEITVGLIRRQLLNLSEYSCHMARFIKAGKSRTAIEFAISLVRTLETTSDARVISELRAVTDALAKVTNRPVVRNDDNQAPESFKPDPLRGEVLMLLTEWWWMHFRAGATEAVRAHHVHEVHRNVLSKSGDIPNRFFSNLLEHVISHYQFEIKSNTLQLHKQDGTSSFLAIDVCTDLVFSILKFDPVGRQSNKLSLFLKVLTAIVGFITNDANKKKTSFDSRPYFRLFISIFNHLNTNTVIDSTDFQVLTALSCSFHALQPEKVPEFRFAWVELVSLKDFMQKLLNEDNRKGWPLFQSLLTDLLRFLEPFLKSGDLTEPVRILYSATLRMLLVLSHDFPEFIRVYYLSLYELIPPHCIELKNVILTALPPAM